MCSDQAGRKIEAGKVCAVGSTVEGESAQPWSTLLLMNVLAGWQR